VKRFWEEVSVEADREGWGIRLDDRPVRTPARGALVVPSRALVDAIADEWRAVVDQIDPHVMPLTGLANAAIDRVSPDPTVFVSGLARFAETDLACYRSAWPPELVECQARCWDPLLAWARRRFDVDFATTSGVMHVAQPPATIDRLGHEVASLDPYRLAAMSPLVTIGGSLIAALGVLDHAISPDEAWAAVSVDERWQLEQWGSDSEAQLALDNRERDFRGAARFLELLDQ
jgi:chaperone required for assembly of F1-ATPase